MGHAARKGDLSETQAALIQNGMNDVQNRGCPTCHQSSNAADGTLSGSDSPVPGTNIYPPNLTSDPDTGLGDWTDAQIMRAILQDIDIEGRPLCWVMPHWMLGQTEVTEIVAYLRSLPHVMHDVPIGMCPPNSPVGADGGTNQGAVVTGAGT
jgi:hypothetical protein